MHFEATIEHAKTLDDKTIESTDILFRHSHLLKLSNDVSLIECKYDMASCSKNKINMSPQKKILSINYEPASQMQEYFEKNKKISKRKNNDNNNISEDHSENNDDMSVCKSDRGYETEHSYLIIEDNNYSKENFNNKKNEEHAHFEELKNVLETNNDNASNQITQLSDNKVKNKLKEKENYFISSENKSSSFHNVRYSSYNSSQSSNRNYSCDINCSYKNELNYEYNRESFLTHKEFSSFKNGEISDKTDKKPSIIIYSLDDSLNTNIQLGDSENNIKSEYICEKSDEEIKKSLKLNYNKNCNQSILSHDSVPTNEKDEIGNKTEKDIFQLLNAETEKIKEHDELNLFNQKNDDLHKYDEINEPSYSSFYENDGKYKNMGKNKKKYKQNLVLFNKILKYKDQLIDAYSNISMESESISLQDEQNCYVIKEIDQIIESNISNNSSRKETPNVTNNINRNKISNNSNNSSIKESNNLWNKNITKKERNISKNTNSEMIAEFNKYEPGLLRSNDDLSLGHELLLNSMNKNESHKIEYFDNIVDKKTEINNENKMNVQNILDINQEKEKDIKMKIVINIKNIYFTKYKHIKCVVTNNSGVIINSFNFYKNQIKLDQENSFIKIYNKNKLNDNLLKQEDIHILLEELQNMLSTNISFELLFDAKLFGEKLIISESAFYRLSFYGIEKVDTGKKTSNQFKSEKDKINDQSEENEKYEKSLYIGFTILHIKYIFQIQEEGFLHLNISEKKTDELSQKIDEKYEEDSYSLNCKINNKTHSSNLTYVDRIGFVFKTLFNHSLNITSPKIFIKYNFEKIKDEYSRGVMNNQNKNFRKSEFNKMCKKKTEENFENIENYESSQNNKSCKKNEIHNMNYGFKKIFQILEKNKNNPTCKYSKKNIEELLKLYYQICLKKSYNNSLFYDTHNSEKDEIDLSKICNVMEFDNGSHFVKEKKYIPKCGGIKNFTEENSLTSDEIEKINIIDKTNDLDCVKEMYLNLYKNNKENIKIIKRLKNIIIKYTYGINNYFDFIEFSKCNNKMYNIYEENKKLKKYIIESNSFFVENIVHTYNEISKLKHSNKTINILYNKEKTNNNLDKNIHICTNLNEQNPFLKNFTKSNNSKIINKERDKQSNSNEIYKHISESKIRKKNNNIEQVQTKIKNCEKIPLFNLSNKKEKDSNYYFEAINKRYEYCRSTIGCFGSSEKNKLLYNSNKINLDYRHDKELNKRVQSETTQNHNIDDKFNFSNINKCVIIDKDNIKNKTTTNCDSKQTHNIIEEQFNESKCDKIKYLKKESKTNLSKTNLSKTNLSKINLNKINLNKINLNKINLNKINLNKINLNKNNMTLHSSTSRDNMQIKNKLYMLKKTKKNEILSSSNLTNQCVLSESSNKLTNQNIVNKKNNFILSKNGGNSRNKSVVNSSNNIDTHKKENRGCSINKAKNDYLYSEQIKKIVTSTISNKKKNEINRNLFAKIKNNDTSEVLKKEYFQSNGAHHISKRDSLLSSNKKIDENKIKKSNKMWGKVSHLNAMYTEKGINNFSNMSNEQIMNVNKVNKIGESENCNNIYKEINVLNEDINNVNYKKKYIENLISSYNNYIPNEIKKNKIINSNYSNNKKINIMSEIQTKEKHPCPDIKAIIKIIDLNLTTQTEKNNKRNNSIHINSNNNMNISKENSLNDIQYNNSLNSRKITNLSNCNFVHIPKNTNNKNKETYILDTINKNIDNSFSQLNKIKKKVQDNFLT
ncbi:conserved Plasmodium protein, unknown function [Plasmodium berghei]|uniref:Uncharacterized protein n=1 Tax=Plasmodium berghei TaxID=5821 RepID=A0A113RHY4_PLABE|nr:conserved Plasmodium protein, unknown function [Plasmodium berghei]SCO59809.1 conserved Plasmodium protein, unknown function [Plasmodium berghei]